MTNRVICLFIHYFDKDSRFKGKSKCQSESVRNAIVSRSLNSLRAVNGVDVVVCGYKKAGLIQIEQDLSKRTHSPQLMVYEALASLLDYAKEYDYFMVVEDDILVGTEVFTNVYDFDQQFGVDQVMLPNRVEVSGERIYCIDTKLMPGTTGDVLTFNGRKLAVGNNPHSGVFLVNREKLHYLSKNIDLGYRERFHGGYMASAFAYYHSPFRLYRVVDGYDYHTVMHLDKYDVPRWGALRKAKFVAARMLGRVV